MIKGKNYSQLNPSNFLPSCYVKTFTQVRYISYDEKPFENWAAELCLPLCGKTTIESKPMEGKCFSLLGVFGDLHDKSKV